jgi:hypothetical protein
MDLFLKTVGEDTFVRDKEMMKALIPAAQSLQISVKFGIKLLAQTAALYWSVEHMFCNFDVGMSFFPKIPTSWLVTASSYPCSPFHILLSYFLLVTLFFRIRVLTTGLFLLQWVHSVEREGLDNLQGEEKAIYRLIQDMVSEDQSTKDELLSMRLLSLGYRPDALHIWGGISFWWIIK